MRKCQRVLVVLFTSVSVCILAACGLIPSSTPTPPPTETEAPPAVLASTGFAEASSHWPDSVYANRVTLWVHRAVVLTKPESGILEDGYVYLVVDVEVFNVNQHSVSYLDLWIVDDRNNHYANWQTVEYPSLNPLLTVESNARVRGWATFAIPSPALDNKPRLRLESDPIECRIEVVLPDDIPVDPGPTPEASETG